MVTPGILSLGRAVLPLTETVGKMVKFLSSALDRVGTSWKYLANTKKERKERKGKRKKEEEKEREKVEREGGRRKGD